MDDFQKKYTRGEGAQYFHDKIPISKFVRYQFVFATLAFIGFPIATGLLAWPAAVGVGLCAGAFVFLANMALMGIRVAVSDGGVDVWVGIRRRNYQLEDIVGVEIESAGVSDYPRGKGAIRRGKRGVAFISSMAKTQGVLLRLSSGTSVFVSTNHPEEMKRAIERAQSGQARGDEINRDVGNSEDVVDVPTSTSGSIVDEILAQERRRSRPVESASDESPEEHEEVPVEVFLEDENTHRR